ncbi:MAG: NADP-dependent oxidoreductase [Acidobacteriaceae bacterium]|nr:NADP-dependent oxidoreductase [Acidobacteriaceae bacterium]MBV9781223.1 NADP-dependent oxidoreductase [Acidobacteriaceae bacterium]
MKAVVIRAYGAPQVLKFEESPDPRIASGEVLIQVVATSVNPFDVKVRSGEMKDFVPLTFPAILGLDVSGVVQEIGPGVTRFAIGDKVFAHASQTYAALCAVKAVHLAKIPNGIDVAEAAALPTVTTTGAQLADLALTANATGTVLVTGAVGNVGRSAVYRAKHHGAFVIAGVLSRQMEEAETLGADDILPLDNENSLESLASLDAVADTVAGAVADKLIRKVKDGGVFASVLRTPRTAPEFPRVRAEYMQVKPAPEMLLEMAEAVRARNLRIPLGQRFALGDADKAHSAVEKHTAGKTVLLP